MRLAVACFVDAVGGRQPQGPHLVMLCYNQNTVDVLLGLCAGVAVAEGCAQPLCQAVPQSADGPVRTAAQELLQVWLACPP